MKKAAILVFSSAMLILAFCPAFAASNLVQTFYVPITEEQYRLYAQAQTVSAEEDTIRSVISITGTFNQTVIYYDQWEDGYEYDISAPVQSTTQIWGDGDTSNGAPPGCAAAACDVVNAGTVISLQSDVLIPGGVRDQGNMYFDGRDKIGSTQQLVITRAMWPWGAPQTIGAMLAGSVEVLETARWGSGFEVPVGIDLGQASFNYTAVSVMAQKDGTTVTVQNPDLTVNTTTTLNQGETVYITGIKVGATITSSGGTVQVDLLTADSPSNYDGRLYSLTPTANLGNTYYSPVSTTRESATATNVINRLIIYNPNSAAITVNTACMTGTAGCPAAQNVPADSSVIIQLPLSPTNPGTLTGAKLTSAGGENFNVISAIDINGTVHNWGFTLVPELSLTPSVVVGWAPGTTDMMRDASPVWITPVADTTVYVDYDGNPATGPLTDPLGNLYDVSYSVQALQAQKITSPGPAGSYDHTGYRIYTTDNTRIAAAWGQDGYSSSGNQTTELDLGTTVLPFPSLTAYKTAEILGDYNGNGGLDPGEVLLYTIRVHNSGITPLTDINILDTLDADVTYVANSSYIGSSLIPDNSLPASRFPLDEGGYDIVVSPSQLLPGEDLYVTFQVTVNDPFPPGKTQVDNNVRVSSVTNAEIFLNTQTELVRQGMLQTTKASSATGLVVPGETIDYTVTVTNTSATPQTGIRLEDPLPVGTTYVANSTVATGPRQKFVYDRFDTLLYTNNDGPESWSGNWTETDGGGGGATGGNVQATNGELRFTTVASAAYRTVDLSAAAGVFTFASLKFNYRLNPAVDAADAVAVEMSANGGGGPWTVLETFTGVQGPSSGSRMYDISGYISNNTTVRFRVTAGYTAGEYFYADNVEIRATGAFTDVLDQFGVVAYGNNNGPNNWAGPWTENDAAGNPQDPATGKVQVNGGVLRLNGPPAGGGNPTEPSVWRAVNLTQHVIGVLQFNASNTAGLAATDTAVVEISGDGISFTTLETFTGSIAAAAKSYDITDYISAATTVRIRITGGYGAAGQYFNADNVEIKAGRQLPVTKDNLPAGANPDLADGVPSNIVLPADGFALAPGEVLTVTYSVTVDDPAEATQIINTVTVTDQEKAPTSTATVIDTVSEGGTIGDLIWLDTISNGVYDTGEPSLYNVRVWLDTNGNGVFDSGVDRETRTGTNGKYIFTRLPAGTYRVHIDSGTLPAGLVLTAGSDPSSPVTITAEEIVLTADFGYANGNPTAAVIGNYIWSDADNDGRQDPGEAGLGSVRMALATGPGADTVYGTPDDVISGTAVTNAFGTYLFTNVAAGTYVVIAGVGPDGIPGNGDDDLGGYTPTTGPESIGSRTSSPLTVTGGLSYMMVDFGFRSGSTYSIGNRTWFDSDSDGAVDTGEPGIKDVTVNLVDASGNVIATTASDVNGGFSFSGVPNGNYTIRIEDANGKLIQFAGTTAASVSGSLAVTVAGADLQGASFGYYATGRVGDTLWRDTNGNGLQDSGEAGIAGVAIDLYKDLDGNGLLDTAVDQFLLSATTDSDGNFMFQSSGGGRFFVSIAAAQAPLSGLVLTTSDDQGAAGFQRTVFLPTVSASNLSADFGFNTPGQIGHAVWSDLNSNGAIDAGEPGISGVLVKLYKDANGNGTFEPATDTLISTTTTDSTGSYVFQASSTGTYYVSVDETQDTLVLMTRTTSDDQGAAGVQQTAVVSDLGTNYLGENFGFVTLSSDLSVTKVANPPGDVYPGDVITYTITVTNDSATTTQTGITVSDPLPANTAFVPGSVTATGPAYITTSATLTADKDTSIQQDNATRNYGATNPLSIRYNTTGSTRRILAHFNLSSIPAGATLNSSDMRYYVTTANGNISSVNIYRLTRDWNEGSSNNANCSAAAGNGATWNTYNCTNNWTTAGGDYDNTTLIGSFAPTPIGYKTVTSANLDTLVQGWMDGSTANNGVILTAVATNSQTSAIRARTTAGQEPRLTVNYTYIDTQVVTTGSTPNLVVPADNFVLPPGESMTVTYQVTVGSTPDITEIRNIASVSTDQTNTRKAFAVNPMKYNSDLQVTKAIQSYSSPCYIGSCTVTYLITLANTGTLAESTITVSDVLPAELSFSSATASLGTYNSGTGNWSIPGPLAGGGSATLTITANVLSKNLTIQNCASLTAANPADQNAGNNTSCASFYPTQTVVSGFRSYQEGGQVAVEWSTSSETGTAGFYLLRLDEVSGRYIRLNNRLLPAMLTSQQGGIYSLTDKGASAERNNTYILIEVEGSGTKSFHGPYIVNANGYKARGVISGGASDITNFFLAAEDSAETPRRASGSATRRTEADGTITVGITGSRRTMQYGQADSASTPGLVENYARYQHPAPAGRAVRAGAQRALKAVTGPDNTNQKTMMKIAVKQDGLYYLSAPEIAGSLGVSLQEASSLIQGRGYALSNQGNVVAYLPDSDNAGIYFYGQALQSIYSQENIYWLKKGKGTLMRVLRGNGPAPVPDVTFTEKAHAEEDRFAVTALFRDPEADFWLWDYIVAEDPSFGSRTFTLQAEGAADVQSLASLTVRLHGFTDTGVALDHHVRVALNGTTIGEDYWKGSEPREVILDFDQQLLFSGSNTVTVTGLPDTGAPYSIFYVDSFDLAYQRVHEAAANALTFNAEGNASATVGGFSTQDILVFDITDPARPKYVSAATVNAEGTTYNVSFPACSNRQGPTLCSPDKRFLAVTADAAYNAARSWAVAGSTLSSKRNAADYLVITTEELSEAAGTLAAYRSSRGLRSMVVRLEDIMDEFNHGISSPAAIRAFLSHAYANWSVPPRYVLLAGKGTFDYRDNQGHGDNLIPPLHSVSPWGLNPSDTLLGDVNADHVPEIAVGRISVMTPQEFQDVIAKIMAHESSGSNKVLLVADRPDNGGDFAAESEAVAGLVPPGYPLERLYLSGYTSTAARQKLIEDINSGVMLINYIGHAGIDRLSKTGFFRTTEIASLSNSSVLPVMLAMTCTVGQFSVPGYDSLSEALVLKKDAGASAVWSPSGLSLSYLAQVLDEGFFSAAFPNTGAALGDIILNALRHYNSKGGPSYIMDIFNLQGDPAMRLW